MALWNKIFSKEYNQTSQKEIHSFLEQFYHRLYLLSIEPCKTLSPFIVSLVSHPNISKIDREVFFIFRN